MKCKLCGSEIPDEKPKTIKVGNYEYETETHDFNKRLKDIKIPQGAELWTFNDCIELHNDEKLRGRLNLKNCWFFIKQPFKFNEERGYVARFDAYSGRSDFLCDGGPGSSHSSLGVRFKWKCGK